MIDRGVIDSRLSRLSLSMVALRKIAKEEQKRFLADDMMVAAAKYYVLEAVQICLDIGNHIISVQGWKRPRDYSAVFTILAENGVYSTELGSRLAEMARFRNRVVHLYDEFDNSLLYSILTQSLDDIDIYVRHVHEFLKRA